MVTETPAWAEGDDAAALDGEGTESGEAVG
jgi:hypothetical protein